MFLYLCIYINTYLDILMYMFICTEEVEEGGAIYSGGIEEGAIVREGGGGDEKKDESLLEDSRHFVKVQVRGADHTCNKTH